MTEFKSDLDLKLRSSGLDPSSYSSRSQYEEHLLEQYKLFVEMADRISARRQSAC